MERGQSAGPQPPDVDAESDAYDLERVIDDYVLMSMLVGNDFLPTLPRLSINEGALNVMFSSYIRIRPSLGGYLHDNGRLHLGRFQVFMRELARLEVDKFKLDVADHQWYQVYKHKAELRGEKLDEPRVAAPSYSGGRGRGRRGGLGHASRRGADEAGSAFADESAFGLPDGFYSALGEASIPIKGNRLVLSRNQQSLLGVIRAFAIRALPKAAGGQKLQMQILPGRATPLDSLIVAKAAEQLGIHVGREYAHDGAMTLYVAAGSPRALAKLELEDSDSDNDGPGGFLGSASTYHALGALEGDDADGGTVSEGGDEADEQAVPDFAMRVADPSDASAIAAYVDACLGEFRDALVVPDGELDLYTQRGDAHDFWQRFEIWKAGYYKVKVDITYPIPDVTLSAEANGAQTFREPHADVAPMCRDYIATVQWVLLYYFQGCQSWSWFYPHHYAPCISDLCAGLTAYARDGFENDEPYTPYEQLMCVLPPYSRKLLPAPLRALMVDIHSPIRDMFPTSFSVDMNGKKMPWEAVVQINFVDIKRIRGAMGPKLGGLSADERRRNSRGTGMAYSYAPLDTDDDAAGVPEYAPPASSR
ncbi:exonuclease II Exo2, partial [Coemansia helicoidea]